jgi:hypothetical protein
MALGPLLFDCWQHLLYDELLENFPGGRHGFSSRVPLGLFLDPL